MLSYNLTADELTRLDPELAILPIASIEQHGPHLPLSTDWQIATAYGATVAEAMGAFLVPALPVSTCREQMGKKGSVWMDPDAFYKMLTSMLLCLKEQGFKKAAILQCHGGIFMLPPTIRQVNATNNPDFMVVNIDMGSVFTAFYAEGITETNTELHAGEVETSLMLHIAPETVHMDRAVDFVPKVPRPYLGYGSIYRATPTGVWGEPTKATAEKGAKMIEVGTKIAVEEINKAFAYMESKEKFGYSYY